MRIEEIISEDHYAVFTWVDGKWKLHWDVGLDRQAAFDEKDYINGAGGKAEVFKKKP